MDQVSVRCWTCNFDNLEEFGFCAGCGTRLMPSCLACSAPILDTTSEALLKTTRRGMHR